MPDAWRIKKHSTQVSRTYLDSCLNINFFKKKTTTAPNFRTRPRSLAWHPKPYKLRAPACAAVLQAKAVLPWTCGLVAVRLGSNRGLGFRVGWFKVLGIEVRKGASEFVCNNLIRRIYVYRTTYTAISRAHIEVRQNRESFRGFQTW